MHHERRSRQVPVRCMTALQYCAVMFLTYAQTLDVHAMNTWRGQHKVVEPVRRAEPQEGGQSGGSAAKDRSSYSEQRGGGKQQPAPSQPAACREMEGDW